MARAFAGSSRCRPWRSPARSAACSGLAKTVSWAALLQRRIRGGRSRAQMQSNFNLIVNAPIEHLQLSRARSEVRQTGQSLIKGAQTSSRLKTATATGCRIASTIAQSSRTRTSEMGIEMGEEISVTQSALESRGPVRPRGEVG